MSLPRYAPGSTLFYTTTGRVCEVLEVLDHGPLDALSVPPGEFVPGMRLYEYRVKDVLNDYEFFAVEQKTRDPSENELEIMRLALAGRGSSQQRIDSANLRNARGLLDKVAVSAKMDGPPLANRIDALLGSHAFSEDAAVTIQCLVLVMRRHIEDTVLDLGCGHAEYEGPLNELARLAERASIRGQ